MQSDEETHPTVEATGLPQPPPRKATHSGTTPAPNPTLQTASAIAKAFTDEDSDNDNGPYTFVASRARGSGRGRGRGQPFGHEQPESVSKAAVTRNPFPQAPSTGPIAATASSRPNKRDPLTLPHLQAPKATSLPAQTPPIDPSPLLQTLQNLNIFPQNFPTETMIVTIKLPPKEPSAPKRIIIMDVTPAFYDTIIEALKTSAPRSIISKSWSLALLVGIGPSPLPENEEDVTQYMFQILFRWSPLSTITRPQVQEIISLSSDATVCVRIITRSRRSDKPHEIFIDTPLDCLAIFSKNMQEAIPRSIKVKSTSLSYQFTLALHDNCPDIRIFEVLSNISSIILNRDAMYSETDKIFQRVMPIHSNFSAAPRISNNWRHVAVFHRQPQNDCLRLLNSLLSLHKSHRAKLLLPTSEPSSRIKNATFSFFNEMKQSKIKTNTNLIDWMVSTFDTFTANNPLSLRTETEEGSASDRPQQRNLQDPWGRQQLPASTHTLEAQQQQQQQQDPEQQQLLQAQLLAAASTATRNTTIDKQQQQQQLILQDLQPLLERQIQDQQQEIQHRIDSRRQPQEENAQAPLANLIPPDTAPLFANQNEALHAYQAQKNAHLNLPKTIFPLSTTSLSPTHSTSLSISFTRTVEKVVYCVEGPILFTRFDFGQMLTVEDKEYGNCCLILCLAAQTKLNPADLALYFTTRAHMLTDANALYDKIELIRDDWTNFCHPSPPPNFLHLASNFPRTQGRAKADWAGSFKLGTTIDFHHISLLAPSEICNSATLFITDNSADDDNDINISLLDAPYKTAYFPPREPVPGVTPSCIIILHRNNHYTLLTPLDHDELTIHQILTILGESAPFRHFPFISSKYSPQTPNIAHLAGLSSDCIDLDDLRVSHQLMCKDIQDNFDRSQPNSQANTSNAAAACPKLPLHGSHDLPVVIDDSPPFLPPQRPLPPALSNLLAAQAASDVPFTSSPLPGGKHGREAENPGSAEVAHTAPRPKDTANTPPPFNNLSLHSASPPHQDDPPFFGMNCNNYVQSSPDDLSSNSSTTAASSPSSATGPPPWSIERIIRCAHVAIEERSRPDSPTNARNIRYLVHRHHLCNIWAPYNTVRMTAACDRFIINNPVITGHTFTHVFPPSSPNTATNSNSSSVDLGELVMPQAHNESIFQRQTGVRGIVSSDTSSVSGSYSASGVGSHVSSSLPPSLDSTGSFHPHMTPTAFASFRPPDCTNRVCASMTFGCFHQNNHACDLAQCCRQIERHEFGWHCPHCDRDYCITCCPVPWDPISSIPSTQNLTQDSPFDYEVFALPVASHSQAGSEV
jgi:hypothetical protein